ncbi:MAG: response regulator transcription factor [Opitutales bacterium]
MNENKQYKILVVDDEEDITELLGFHLRAKGFVVETINDPNLIFGKARELLPDLFLLDVMMPGLSGVQICRILRADPELRHAPIVFLTAKTGEEDRVYGLEAGADDYVCKPFSIQELILRVQSLLRRTGKRVTDEEGGKKWVAGKISIDEARHEVHVGGRAVELTATEFRLLSLLVERKGRVQSREQLLTNVWNYNEEMETRTIDTHIRRIREKFGEDASLIETVRGVGYRVTEE